MFERRINIKVRQNFSGIHNNIWEYSRKEKSESVPSRQGLQLLDLSADEII